MRTLLLFLLLGLGRIAAAQVSTLPTDSASGRVVYQGIVQAPNASGDELYRRAKLYLQAISQGPQMEEATKSVSGAAEKQLIGNANRTLRYVVHISAKEGRYRYELSDFQNKTQPVQYKDPLSGQLLTAPGGQAPLERVLANPDGYRKGKPSTALLAYQQAVQGAAEQAVADLRKAMQGAAAGKEW